MSKFTGLGTIKVGGKLRPIHVDSIRQSEKYCEYFDIELDEYWLHIHKVLTSGSLGNTKHGLVFIWSALYAGAIRVDRRCDFTHDDVVDWYETVSDEELSDDEEVVKAAEIARGAEWAKPIELLLAAFEVKKKQLIAAGLLVDSPTA
jgi:hypothetical protein